MRRIFQPEVFQGDFRKKDYFEGWYFKLIDRKMEHVLAFIPGVAFGKDGEAHSFIQYFDAVGGSTHYLRYPITAFESKKQVFDVEIGDNHFSKDAIRLNMQSEELVAEGALQFVNIVSYPSSRLYPGIMGPFSFVPFMECYHGVVNIHHDLVGELNINGEKVDFTGGYGYIEKDWGRSFPKAWIWMQSNHFEQKDMSFMFSVAKIPWGRFSFTGFLSFLRIGTTFYRFATYTGAKIVSMKKTRNMVEILLKDRRHILKIRAIDSSRGELLAPKNGEMVRSIEESIDARLYLSLWNKKGEKIWTAVGNKSGLEIVNFEEL